MKANKATLIAQAIGMYVMHLPLYILFIVELIPGEHGMLAKGLLIAALILMVPVFLLCVANIVLSVVSVFKGETDMSPTVMKVKLALIPWYVINFVMGVVIVAILFNPFMIIGIPVVIGILAGIAYFCMLATSLPNVGLYLRKVFVKKEELIAAPRVLPIIFHFIFCLDVVGSIIFYVQNKKAPLPQITESECE